MSDEPVGDLRLRAEERLADKPLELATGVADLQRLVHELRVHQIELEIQNEDLVAARDRAEKMLAEATALRKQTDIANHLLSRANAELNALNKMMVGRELVMVSLKQQVNALCRELGQEPPYPVGFPPSTANIYHYFSDDWK